MAILLPLCQSLWLGRKVYAPVICNHCPPTYGEQRGQRLFILTALLKALYCGDLLRVIALLFIRYLRNITSPALTWYCEGTQKVIAPHISPAILVGGGGGRGYKWLVHYYISPGHFSLKKQNCLLRQRQGLFRGWSWLFAGTRPPENSAVAISVRRFLTRGGHLGEFHCATYINVIY